MIIALSDDEPTVLNPKNSPPHRCKNEDLESDGVGAYTCKVCGRILLGY